MIRSLFQPEEFEEVKSSLEDDMKKAGVEGFQTEVVFKFFIDRVRANLHVALCMSPVGEMFRYIFHIR